MYTVGERLARRSCVRLPQALISGLAVIGLENEVG